MRVLGQPRGIPEAGPAALPDFYWERDEENPLVCALLPAENDSSFTYVEILTVLKTAYHVRALDIVCPEEGILYRAGTTTVTVL